MRTATGVTMGVEGGGVRAVKFARCASEIVADATVKSHLSVRRNIGFANVMESATRTDCIKASP